MALAALPAKATVYTDATGDTDTAGALDMTSVSVVNDATTLTFTFNLAGDPTAQNWYNYGINISKNLFGGVGGNGNAAGGWSMDNQMSVGGMDYFIGAYPSFAGYDLRVWDGVSAWNNPGGGASSQNSTSVTVPVALSALGLSVGDTFTFDAWTHSSGNNIFDALSDTTFRSWNGNPFDTGANALSYTVVVPEPTSLALIGLGSLFLIVRRKVSVR